ncbi:MAG: hypothetical protein BroJett030_03330 [Alphaproteobacteria bacterium]|nr:MAG: hypothetical protein BroJett030_03330 [Alphaproteobacteria bacterium]
MAHGGDEAGRPCRLAGLQLAGNEPLEHGDGLAGPLLKSCREVARCPIHSPVAILASGAGLALAAAQVKPPRRHQTALRSRGRI